MQRDIKNVVIAIGVSERKAMMDLDEDNRKVAAKWVTCSASLS